MLHPLLQKSCKRVLLHLNEKRTCDRLRTHGGRRQLASPEVMPPRLIAALLLQTASANSPQQPPPVSRLIPSHGLNKHLHLRAMLAPASQLSLQCCCQRARSASRGATPSRRRRRPSCLQAGPPGRATTTTKRASRPEIHRHRAGPAPRPQRGQSVKAEYTLTLDGFSEDGGRVVDSSKGFMKGPFAYAGTGGVIKGWDLVRGGVLFRPVNAIAAAQDTLIVSRR